MIPKIPLGIRHPHPHLNSADPDARRSRLHDENGYPWAGQLGDFAYMNVFPWSDNEPGSVGTFTVSQLREYGFWGAYDRVHIDHASRVRRPWLVSGVMVSITRNFRHLHA
jgi:hypothetical protein